MSSQKVVSDQWLLKDLKEKLWIIEFFFVFHKLSISESNVYKNSEVFFYTYAVSYKFEVNIELYS